MRSLPLIALLVVLGSPRSPAQPIFAGPFVRGWRIELHSPFYWATSFGHGGDLDGDGYDDFALGNQVAPRGPAGPVGTVRAYRGLDGSMFWEHVGQGPMPSCPPTTPISGHLGWKKLVLADLDADGATDVLASAHTRCILLWPPQVPTMTSGLTGFLVGIRGMDGSTLFDFPAPSVPWSGNNGTTQGYGFSFDGGEDLTGDGIPDLLGSAYIWFLPGEPWYRGVVFVSEVSNWAPPLAVLPGVPGEGPGGAPAYEGDVAFLGDVTGDGISEFLVSASSYDLGTVPSWTAVEVGTVRMYDGATFQVLNSVVGTTSWQRVGFYMGALPDVDGDGKPDFYHSEWTPTPYPASWGPAQPFAVVVRSGASFAPLRTISFLGAVPAVSFTNAQPERPGALEDTDGEGAPAIVLNTIAHQPFMTPPLLSLIRIVSLKTGEELHHFLQPSTPTSGRTIGAGGGDLNGDGLSDLLLQHMAPANYGPYYSVLEAWLTRNLRLEGEARPGVRSALRIQAPAWPGGHYLLLLSAGTEPPISLGPFTIPLQQHPLLWFSVAAGLGGTLDAEGRGVFPFAIPGDPTLSGATLYASGIVLNPANPYGVGTILTVERLDIQ